MSTDHYHRLAAGLAAALLSLAAQAATQHPAIEFKSGGVGQGGVQAMHQQMADYSTGLTFANKAGQYLADVRVSIKDRHHQEVLSTVTEGPILLVDLPPGRYTVNAEFEGRSVERDVSVPARGHRQTFVHI